MREVKNKMNMEKMLIRLFNNNEVEEAIEYVKPFIDENFEYIKSIDKEEFMREIINKSVVHYANMLKTQDYYYRNNYNEYILNYLELNHVHADIIEFWAPKIYDFLLENRLSRIDEESNIFKSVPIDLFSNYGNTIKPMDVVKIFFDDNKHPLLNLLNPITFCTFNVLRIYNTNENAKKVSKAITDDVDVDVTNILLLPYVSPKPFIRVKNIMEDCF